MGLIDNDNPIPGDVKNKILAIFYKSQTFQNEIDGVNLGGNAIYNTFVQQIKSELVADFDECENAALASEKTKKIGVFVVKGRIDKRREEFDDYLRKFKINFSSWKVE